jgi:hypothetical protein
MTIKDLENRISAVEQEIAQLKAERLTSAKRHPIHALEKLHGTFEDDEAFREAMRLGRKWRDSYRPKPRSTKARK